MNEPPVESTDENRRDPVEAEIRRVCDILGSIAKAFPPDSKEGLALEEAALAFEIVQRHTSMKKSYERMRPPVGGELTEEMNEEMEAYLRRMGIDPDDPEDELDGVPETGRCRIY